MPMQRSPETTTAWRTWQLMSTDQASQIVPESGTVTTGEVITSAAVTSRYGAAIDVMASSDLLLFQHS